MTDHRGRKPRKTSAHAAPQVPPDARDPAAEWLDPTKLVPWAANPRRNEDAVKKVKASIARFGFGAPIVARRDGLEIIAGHARHLAALELRLPAVPVRLLDLTATEAHALALADTRVAEESSWDKHGLADVLEELRAEDALDDALGFDADELDKLLAGGAEAVVREVDVSTVRDEFWLSMRGPLPAQADALDAMRRALEAVPGCTVDVGTTKW